MIEVKLEMAVNELINNTNTKQKQSLLETIGELLLNISYFQIFLDNYPDLGPLMYSNLINNLSFKKYKEKTTIWDYNDPVDGVYIIISGEVKIYKPPDKLSLIRCKDIQKKKRNALNKINNLTILEQVPNIKEKYKPILKLPQYALNLMKKRSSIIGNNYFKQQKHIVIKEQKYTKIQKFPSSRYINNLSIGMNIHKNISFNEQQISLTEENYLYREPQEFRRLDYIEKFGKMIGEDALLQESTNRKYACETGGKCILAFLSARNYHIFFDKINNKHKGNIISFLYKVNYFNNRNDFIHKLYKAIINKNYKKGTFLYKKNMPYLYMYILKSGTVSLNIEKKTKFTSEIIPDLMFGYKKNMKNNISLNDIPSINKNDYFEHFTKERTFEINGEYDEKKIYTLINYGKGEILGNIEFYLKLGKYLFSVKCLTDVELLEIDMKIFKSIYKAYNIEFLREKTRQQIKYLSNRIKEINLIHEKNDEDQFRSRNKFMRIFYQRHPISALKINDKYINNGEKPFKVDLKYKNKKLKKTKISPFCLYELASALSNNKKQNLSNLFITNNKNSEKKLNGSNNNMNLFNLENQLNNKNEIFNLNKIKKFKIKGQNKNIKNPNQKPNYKRFLESNEKLNITQKFKSSSFSLNSELYNTKKQYKILEHKAVSQKYLENNPKNKLRFSYSAFNLNFIENKKKSADFINTFMKIFRQVQIDKLKKEEEKYRKQNSKKMEVKEKNTMIAFKGYQVYLNKNKTTRINLKKHH